jgi:class 3 adenylate cyclase
MLTVRDRETESVNVGDVDNHEEIREPDMDVLLEEDVLTTTSSMVDRRGRFGPEGQRTTPLVLIVEDSPTQALYLQALLDQQDLETVLASDGRKGLDLAHRLIPDLIVLDMEMPEMNGDEVLALLKADAELWGVPVIMVSALDQIENVAHCIEMGAEDYLLKPFNATLLSARISASLDKKRMRDQERSYVRQIEAERARFDELLRVLLPDEIVEELESTGVVKPRLYPDVAVVFVDVVDFTPYCNDREPEEVFLNLQLLAEEYENLALKHGLQKIKTTGDTFLATAGLLKPLPNPVLNCVRCALDMVPMAQELPARWQVRAGIHVGPVMAGVVGRRKYLFDIWGNTVNTAQRIESYGKDGAVNLSRDAWQRVRDYCDSEFLGAREVKGKGQLDIYQVVDLRETVGGRRGS